MTRHIAGTREEWLAKRLELLDAEKEHTTCTRDVSIEMLLCEREECTDS